MNKTMKIILAVSAIAAGTALTAAAIILTKNGKLDEIIKKFKKEEESCQLDDNIMIKNKLRRIARQINKDIKATEKRISQDHHGKRQNDYEKMNWGKHFDKKNILN